MDASPRWNLHDHALQASLPFDQKSKAPEEWRRNGAKSRASSRTLVLMAPLDREDGRLGSGLSRGESHGQGRAVRPWQGARSSSARRCCQDALLLPLTPLGGQGGCPHFAQ